MNKKEILNNLFNLKLEIEDVKNTIDNKIDEIVDEIMKNLNEDKDNKSIELNERNLK